MPHNIIPVDSTASRLAVIMRHDWATTASRHKTDPKSLQQAGSWSSPAMPMRYIAGSEIANAGVKLKPDPQQ